MKIIEAIKIRKSVRSYNGEKLSEDVTQKLNAKIASIEIKFGAKVRFEVFNIDDTSGIKLGTYGVISGAKTYIAAVYEPSKYAQLALGYAFEQIVLYCAQIGLGTCWLGGTYNKSAFSKAVDLKGNELLPIVSPVGIAAIKQSFMSKVFSKMSGQYTRKAFESMFFIGDFNTPLTESSENKFTLPLQMVRIAPSASNKQPWTVLIDNSKVHFYSNGGYATFAQNDIGIALCHFDLTCKELGMNGKIYFDTTQETNNAKTRKYVVSYEVME